LNHAFSKPFDVKSGDRQGGVLPPCVFNIFINVIITELKLANNGCIIQDRFIGCLLHADDIILLSPSVHGLQRMFNICHETTVELGTVFNCFIVYCICFGRRWKCDISPMQLGNSHIHWAVCIDYPGVHICAGRPLTFDVSSVKQSFFMACNCTYRAVQYNNQLHLVLQEAYCKPIPTYSIAAMTLNAGQMHTLNCCWNSEYRRIFGFNKWASVRSFICHLGRFDFLSQSATLSLHI
jgi:hypothetical protein